MLFVLYRNMCIDARDFEFIFFSSWLAGVCKFAGQALHRKLNPTEAQLGCVISAIAAGHRLVTG